MKFVILPDSKEKGKDYLALAHSHLLRQHVEKYFVSGNHELRTAKKKIDMRVLRPQRVVFTDTGGKNKKSEMLDPIFPDRHYPAKGYFNAEKLTTVLIFSDGSKIKVASDSGSKGKNANKGVIIALARRILGSQTSVSDLYEKFKTETNVESMFYGVVMGYFVSRGIVRDAEMFDKWMVEFLANRIQTFK